MSKVLFYNTVTDELSAIIKTICAANTFQHFRLCGGTAIALQIGNRISVDADFISELPIDANKITHEILKIYGNDVANISQGTRGVFMKIKNIKVDFLSWQIPFIREPLISGGITLTNLEELIAMKLFAISQRGEKKDYMDIASLLSTFTLQQMLGFYTERHKGTDKITSLRMLAAYADIEKQPEPLMLNNLTWKQAKSILAFNIKNVIEAGS